jgi:hypothetical protein
VKYTLLLSLLLISTISNAEPYSISIDAYCDETDRIFSALNMMKEIPIAIAQANDQAESKVLLWVGPAKETWTLTATKDKITCVIGYGSDFKLIIPRNKNST